MIKLTSKWIRGAIIISICLGIIISFVLDHSERNLAYDVIPEGLDFERDDSKKINLAALNMKKSYKPPHKYDGVVSFAVSENETYIAVIPNGSARIQIYKSTGEYLYTLTFDYSSNYAVRYNGDMLELLLLTRDASILTIDPEGNIVDTRGMVTDTRLFFTYFYRQSIHIGNNTYYKTSTNAISRWLHLESQIIKRTSEDKEVCLVGGNSSGLLVFLVNGFYGLTLTGILISFMIFFLIGGKSVLIQQNNDRRLR